MNDDPFRELGVRPSADADEIRAAWRKLAKQHHPDAGGDAARMQRVNAAAAAALSAVAIPPAATRRAGERPARDRPRHDQPGNADFSRVRVDAPSFTVEALPAETFEALLVVVTWIGELLDDDPPYRLEAHLLEPITCWCRLELVPDAGASTVTITIAQVGDTPLPAIELVRDVWIDQLNRYDW